MDQSLLLVVAAGMFVMMFFSNRKRKRQAAETAEKVQPGAKVMLNSGIFATIISVDGERAVVESTPGTRLEVSKAAIVRFIADATTVEPEAEKAEEASIAPVTAVAKAAVAKKPAAKPAAKTAAKPAAKPSAAAATKTPAKKATASKPAAKTVK